LPRSVSPASRPSALVRSLRPSSAVYTFLPLSLMRFAIADPMSPGLTTPTFLISIVLSCLPCMSCPMSCAATGAPEGKSGLDNVEYRVFRRHVEPIPVRAPHDGDEPCRLQGQQSADLALRARSRREPSADRRSGGDVLPVLGFPVGLRGARLGP